MSTFNAPMSTVGSCGREQIMYINVEIQRYKTAELEQKLIFAIFNYIVFISTSGMLRSSDIYIYI